MQQHIQKSLNEIIEVFSSLYRHVYSIDWQTIQNKLSNVKIVINEQADILDDWLAVAEIRLKKESQAFFAPLNTKITPFFIRAQNFDLKQTLNSSFEPLNNKINEWIKWIDKSPKSKIIEKDPYIRFTLYPDPPSCTAQFLNWIADRGEVQIEENKNESFDTNTEKSNNNFDTYACLSFPAYLSFFKDCKCTFFQAASKIYNPVVQNLLLINRCEKN